MLYFFILIIISSTLCAQNIKVNEITQINDTLKKAKLSIIDEKGDDVIPNINEFLIIENLSEAKIISIHCDTSYIKEPISSVLTIDVSGSMWGNGLLIAKEASKLWIDELYNFNKNSECGLTTFSTYSNILFDLTNLKDLYSYYLLKASINSLYANGWTNYDDGFYHPQSGGITLLKKANYRKILIFLTDGFPAPNPPNENNIINYALENNIEIYPVVIGFEAPNLLKKVAKITGGKYFDNIFTPEQAREAYLKIFKAATKPTNCEIIWKSSSECSNIEFTYKPFNISHFASYKHPEHLIPILTSNSKFINLGTLRKGFTLDTNVIFTAKNKTIKIDTITCSNVQYSLDIPSSINFPILLKPDSSINIKISIKVSEPDSLRNYLIVKSNSCEENIIEFISLNINERKTKPQPRYGFGVSSLLTEINNLDNALFKGYQMGFGLQIYFSDDFAIRFSYGFLNLLTTTKLIDRAKQNNYSKYFSILLRYNIFYTSSSFGYLGFNYCYSNTLGEVHYLDGFTKGNELTTHSYNAIFGAEFFVYHHISLSFEYLLGYEYFKQYLVSGFNEKNYFLEKQGSHIKLFPKFNFILSYFIN